MKMRYKALIITLMMIGLPSLFILPALTNSLVLAEFDDEPGQLVGEGPTLTPTFCPHATSEPLWVDPVISPTGILNQTIVIHIGNGEWAGVTLETGEFTETGDFGLYSNPAAIKIDLLPNWTHHLTVAARVKVVDHGGCQYGGYTLTTTRDREGNPLTIIQSSDLPHLYFYLPIIVYGTEESPNPTTPPPSITIAPHNCDPSYPTDCIPPPPPDLYCTDIPFRNFQVLPPDPHNFDGDKDGVGCEAYKGQRF